MIIINITIIGRGLVGQKVARNPFLSHPSGEQLVCGLVEKTYTVGTLLPKKFPSKKPARYQENG